MNLQLSTAFLLQGAAEETLGHNLVRSPSFPLGSIEPGRAADWKLTGTVPGHFGEEPNHYLGMLAQSRVWQDIDLPVLANGSEGTRPLYQLRLEYDATWYDECWVRVYHIEEGQEEQLLSERVLQGDPSRADVTWKVLELFDIKARHDTRRIRVRFETPASPGKIYLYLKDVHVQLWLPPLSEATGVELVMDPAGIPIPQSGGPGHALLLCHGAQHRLQIKAGAGDTWAGQPASLVWHDDASQPLAFGLLATPGFNERDQDLDDLYQPLPAGEQAVWEINASPEQDIHSGDLAVGLGSYWVAPRYLLNAKVGDFRYDVDELVWDGVVPIASLGNSTRLTATLKSPYADERPIRDVEILWLLNNREYKRTLTDNQGQAVLDYIAKTGDADENNRVSFAATCIDDLQQPSSQTKQLPMFNESPWVEELLLSLDGKPVTALDGLALPLFRGGVHTLLVKPKSPDSYFIGRDIVMQWPGPAEASLGITFPTEPKLMTESGVSWVITAGTDDSGVFVLELVDTAGEDGVALPVPLSLKGAQLSASLADEVELQMDGEIPVAGEVFWRTSARTVSVVAKPGSPLKDMQLDAWLTFTAGTLDQSQMMAQPTYSSKRPLTEAGLSWALTGAAASGTFGLAVQVQGFSIPLSLDGCALLSSQLADEADLQVAGQVPGSPEVFRRNTRRVVSLVPKASSPLKDIALQAHITFTQGTLQASQVVAQPTYSTSRPLSAAGLSWDITGTAVSGTFGLVAQVQGFSTPLSLPACVLLSLSLADEVEFQGASSVIEGPAYFVQAASRAVRIVAKPESPIKQLNLNCKLEFIQTDTLTANDFSVEPPFGQSVQMSGGVKAWELKGGGAVRGKFGLKASVEGFDDSLMINDCRLISPYLKYELFLTGDNGGQTMVWPIDLDEKLSAFSAQDYLIDGALLYLKLVSADESVKSNLAPSPGFDERVKLPAVWKLGNNNAGAKGIIELEINADLPDVTLEPVKIKSAVMSGYVENEVTISPASINMRPDSFETLTVTPKSDSPIAQANYSATLYPNQINIMTSSPDFGIHQDFYKAVSWRLGSKNRLDTNIRLEIGPMRSARIRVSVN